MNVEPDKFLPTRTSLIERLRDWEDHESWRDFFETYWKLIYNTAVKSGLRDAEAQDVVQETVIAVAKQMPEFQYDPKRGSFKGWLRRLTLWRIKDQLRKSQRSAPPLQSDAANYEPAAEREMEAMWDREWESNLVDAAIQKIKRTADPLQFQMFELYVLREVPAGKVARSLGVTVARVYLAKHRISRLVQRELIRLQAVTSDSAAHP